MEAFEKRAETEIREGRPWRAKEILRGNICTRPYSPELYGRYGELLIGLGDELEAGKYLFLAGSDDARHRQAIDLFLRRCGPSGGELHSRFPARARRLSLEHYPPMVREALSSRGYTGGERDPRDISAAETPNDFQSVLIMIGCLASVVFLGVLCVIGAFTLFSWFS